jgi:hypothetical protein
MTNGGIRPTLVPGITLKIGFPLLIGLIALVSAQAGGMSGRNSLALAAVVTFGAALILFIVDTEIRISAVNERVAEGFAKIGRSAELSSMMERSVLDTALLADFLETAGRTDGRVSPLLQRLARREIERVTSFVRQLPVGSEIAYDGEDRDWLLGLTREAESSIDAISLSTVDAGVRGLDGGLWTSDLGLRYLELQREAITRKVRIRRIFVFENADMALDEDFLRITEIQRAVGVEVRMLDHMLIPAGMQSMIFDFIVFDGTVSYETTPATAFAVGQTRPGILRTRLAPMPGQVRDREDQFEQLWEAADPERQINELAGTRIQAGSVSPGAANTYRIRSTSSAGSCIASRADLLATSSRRELSQANWLRMVRTASSTGRKRGDKTESVV